MSEYKVKAGNGKKYSFPDQESADKFRKASKTKRILYKPKTDKYGLCVEPDLRNASNEDRAKREMQERLNRLDAAVHFHYEDPYTRTSPSRTYHDKGTYKCDECNKLAPELGPDICGFLDEKENKVNEETDGSCAHFEDECAGDREMRRKRGFTKKQAGYGENKGGFGCGETEENKEYCPYGNESINGSDSVGRDIYCRVHDCRVFDRACCEVNGKGEKKPQLFQIQV